MVPSFAVEITQWDFLKLFSITIYLYQSYVIQIGVIFRNIHVYILGWGGVRLGGHIHIESFV